MDIKYGLLSADKKTIIDEVQLIDGKIRGKTAWLGKLSNPSHEQWIAAGYVLFIDPVIGPQQKDSYANVIDLQAETYTHRVDDWTPEDIAAAAAILTRQEILDFKKASPELVALLKDSDLEIDADVIAETAGLNNAEVVAAIRTAMAKNRKMLRDLSIVVKAIVTQGG